MSKSHLCQPHRYGSIKYSFPWYLKLDYLRKTISMVLKIIKHNSFNRRAPSSSVQSCPTLCDPIDCSMPSLPVHHQLLEFTQTKGGRRRRGWPRMRWLDGITDSTDMGEGRLWQLVKDRDAWHAVVHGVTKSQTRLRDWTELKTIRVGGKIWVLFWTQWTSGSIRMWPCPSKTQKWDWGR